ncbi:lytic transglycosylase domain-containing protein [Bacillus sp. FJAT-49736]|uniref:lytic transglycosylase domain-containing protein n=1 Tax=Bacillus sp. FJAT-49736 TaxID=2833582 RepID=UPI001BC9E2A5|nr:lytic transglycosylase domain-containing protein [Bacillus sp. FJAT-49736]MBS4172994.1 lytic transglycosylase domain-containing protein [Bacillus sp. FJAT-49736]
MAAKKKLYKKRKTKKQSPLIIILIPIAIMVLYFWANNQNEKLKPSKTSDLEIPAVYIPIYKAAEHKYGVPWYVLAAHHRVETRFSTMKTMVSPVGAEGPMQIMPCTFVGWKHPTCSGLGKGNIPKKDKENPAIIQKYGGYGVDADGDGIADPFNIYDAVFSAANYLAQNGASSGHLRKAIYSYNHSNEYVKEVLHYVKEYKQEF